MLSLKPFLILPSVKKIQVIKGLTETKSHETETVTLEVELSQADVEGFWTRDGAKLKSGANCRITAFGKKHSLTLSNLKREDAGVIAFQAEGVHNSGKLVVTGKLFLYVTHTATRVIVSQRFQYKKIDFTELPAMIAKPMVDISVADKEKVTFECEVSKTNADVKWFKVRSYLIYCLLWEIMRFEKCHVHTECNILKNH